MNNRNITGSCNIVGKDTQPEVNGLLNCLRTCKKLELPYYKAQFKNRFFNIHKRVDSDISDEKLLKKRLCNLGIDRMLINVDGSIFPCKQSSRGKHLLGDIYNGLNLKRYMI